MHLLLCLVNMKLLEVERVTCHSASEMPGMPLASLLNFIHVTKLYFCVQVHAIMYMHYVSGFFL